MTTTVPPLLTAAQRDQFTRFPLLDEPTLSRNYLLSTDDLILIRQRRLEFNKLGYAVQLTVLRHLGRSIRLHEQLPGEVLQYLADQLHVDPDCYELYASRDTTRREHFAALCLHLGYVALSRTLNHELRDWLLPAAVLTDQPFPLMATLIDELRRRKILTPRLKVLERLIGVARIRADQHVYTLLNFPLKADLAARVDALLEPQEGESVSRLAWLSRPVGAPKARHLLTLLDKLAFVRTFPVQDHPATHLPQSRLEQLAQEGRRISASHLAAFEPQRRRATVMARLLDLSRTLTDEVLDMHDRLMISLIRAGEQAASLAYQSQGPTVVEQLGQYQQVLGAIVLAREQGRDPYQAIEAVLPWEDLVNQVRNPEKTVSVEQLDPLWEVIRRYPKVRSYAQRLLTAFSFTGEGSAAPLVKAIDLLREMYASNKRTLPEGVPLSFVRQKWMPYVTQNAELDRKAYELCVLDELRLALKSGDLWVAGSHKYRDLDAYLLPQTVWPERLMELPLDLPETFEAFWEKTEPVLTGQLQEVLTS